MFRGLCIVIYSYNKIQRDALFLKFIFDKDVLRLLMMDSRSVRNIGNMYLAEWERVTMVYVSLMKPPTHHTSFCLKIHYTELIKILIPYDILCFPNLHEYISSYTLS